MAGDWKQWKIGRSRLWDIPITAILCLSAVVTFFSGAIFHSSDPLSHLAFSTARVIPNIWTLITWPLYSSPWDGPIGTLLAVVWCFWVCGSIERSWGTQLFVNAFVVSTIATAILLIVISRLLGIPASLTGLWVAIAPVTVAWGVINRRETIMLYCILPVPAMGIALLATVLAWYRIGPPILGLSAVAVCGIAYWYVSFGRDNVNVNVGAFRAVAKKQSPRQQHGEDLPTMGVGLSPSKWLKERQERKRFEKLFGGPDRPKKK